MYIYVHIYTHAHTHIHILCIYIYVVAYIYQHQKAPRPAVYQSKRACRGVFSSNSKCACSGICVHVTLGVPIYNALGVRAEGVTNVRHTSPAPPPLLPL